jgi:hypothetical protein
MAGRMPIGRWMMVVAILLPAASATAGKRRQPVELGRVDWLRSFPKAQARARSTGKPILLLFDEVPGCHTCTQFGKGPLSHPIVVAAASDAFVPVAIYNNVKGRDAAVLKRFNEPAWNNPVVRFVDAQGRDMIPRRDGDYSTASLLNRMAQALRKANRPVPPYLESAAWEYAPPAREIVTFAMHCYWVGEQRLGTLSGVLATRIGMLAGMEVVEVEFDPTRRSLESLIKAAGEFECARRVIVHDDAHEAIARELVGDAVLRTDERVNTKTTQQYHLSKFPALYYLPLTQLQATRLNAAVANGTDRASLLAPTQRQLYDRLVRALRNKRFVNKLRDVKPTRAPNQLGEYAAHLDRLLGNRR